MLGALGAGPWAAIAGAASPSSRARAFAIGRRISVINPSPGRRGPTRPGRLPGPGQGTRDGLTIQLRVRGLDLRGGVSGRPARGTSERGPDQARVEMIRP